MTNKSSQIQVIWKSVKYLNFRAKNDQNSPGRLDCCFLAQKFINSSRDSDKFFLDINRQSAHIFGEDPSQYVDEVKQSLAGERGLSPRNRDLVMEVLGRLADRVQSAENSRNAVVNELVSLRERFQVP